MTHTPSPAQPSAGLIKRRQAFAALALGMTCTLSEGQTKSAVEQSFALLLAGNVVQAEQVSTAALASDGGNTVLRLLRGYSRQMQGRRADAQVDFTTLLSQVKPKSSEDKAYRLIVADMAMAAGDEHLVADLLQPLLDASPAQVENQIVWRLRAARAKLWSNASDHQASAAPDAAITLECQNNGASCQLKPATAVVDPAYQFADQAYALLAQKNANAAVGKARLAQRLDPGNASYTLLLLDALQQSRQWQTGLSVATQALSQAPSSADLLLRRGEMLSALGQEAAAKDDYANALKQPNLSAAQKLNALNKLGLKEEAKIALNQSIESGEKPFSSNLDLAYMAIKLGDDPKAIQAFERADQFAPLATDALKNAAYTAMRLGRDEQAKGYLTRAADVVLNKPNADRSNDDTASLQDVRRTMAGLTREWGTVASVSYRNAALGRLGADSAAATNSAQIGAEAYWRPLGKRNGKPLEIYARAFETVYSRNGDATGTNSLQTTVGVRYKPLSDQNLILSIGRTFPPSAYGRPDTLGQIAYSYTSGGDLRTNEDSWFTQQYYAELGRFTGAKQNYATANARIGMSYRLDSLSPNLVAIPHVVIAEDYNNAYATRNAFGLGPGLQMRYWYRQDTYNAYRSYVDLTLQYRVKLAGDEQRAKGAFLTLLTSY